MHGHPDVRLHDLVLQIVGRHRAERQEKLHDAPVPPPVGLRAARPDQHAVVGGHHLEARHPVTVCTAAPIPKLARCMSVVIAVSV
jgi:hypothetical protein